MSVDVGLELINRICVVLEAVSIVLCLHKLYGKKFVLDIATVSVIVIELIMMTAIDYFHLPSAFSILFYVIVALYCGIKFGFKWRAIIVNCILYLAILGGLQVVLMLIGHYVLGVNYFEGLTWLMLNIISVLIIALLPGKLLRTISVYLQDKEKILIISLFMSIAVAAYCIVSFKNLNMVELEQTVLFFACIILIVFLVVQLNKYRVKTKEIETELKMHKLYGDSFESLIQDIRVKQHEFDNHINTIYSQHFSCHTYEELVEVQKNYCEVLMEENRYNKLLSSGNSILVGFLYGKFIEIDKRDIDIAYKVSIGEMKSGMPVYKIVEILGDLINNAVEAIEMVGSERKLYVAIQGNGKNLEIEVRNIYTNIPLEEIHLFFHKGYSKKGTGRGLGLYNVKKICEEHGLEIECKNKVIETQNWISFTVKSNDK